MQIKKTLITFLLGLMALTGAAQEKTYQLGEITVINYGDGRYLFRQIDKDQTPLNGKHRIIDGYHSEVIVADFKDGMYNGDYQYFKNNKLKEQGTYKEGRKDGMYKTYNSDGETVQEERPYKEGKVNGVAKKFYTNGNVETESTYTMSKEDGPFRKYDYETGKLKTEQNYKNGVLNGEQFLSIVSNIGNYIERSTYDMGKQVGEFSQYFDDGTPKTIGQYNKLGKKDGEWFERSYSREPNEEKLKGTITIYKDGNKVSTEEVKNYDKYLKKKK